MVTKNSCNTSLTVGSNSEVAQPLQSCFLLYLSSTSANVTGDGTLINPLTFDTEVFDQNGDVAASIFTAPVDGRYLFTYTVAASGFTTSHTYVNIVIITTDGYLYGEYTAPGKVFDVDTEAAWSATGIIELDAADTAKCYFQVSNGTKVVDVLGAASPDYVTHFSGVLLT